MSKVLVERTAACMCDLVGKKCSGAFSYYITTEGKMGIRILDEAVVLTEGQDLHSLFDTPEFKAILDKMAYKVYDDKMEIKTEYDIDPDEVNKDTYYPIAKLPYAKSFLYIISMPGVRDHVNTILEAFGLAVYLNNELKNAAEAPAPGSAEELAMGPPEPPPGPAEEPPIPGAIGGPPGI